MAILKTTRNRYDGQNITGYHRVKELRIFFDENRADISGVVYVSEDAFLKGHDPVDSFGAKITDLNSALTAKALDGQDAVQKWLLAMPEFQGATELQEVRSSVVEARGISDDRGA